jgi:hypothetical protein
MESTCECESHRFARLLKLLCIESGGAQKHETKSRLQTDEIKLIAQSTVKSLGNFQNICDTIPAAFALCSSLQFSATPAIAA